MKYDITEVCKSMLDNADMEADFSAYPTVRLRFLVYGSVDGKFWQVRFVCSETVKLEVENDSDVTANEWHVVLEASVIGKNPNSVPDNIQSKIESRDVDSVWYISVFGHLPIDIFCLSFNWELNELSKEEYESRHA